MTRSRPSPPDLRRDLLVLVAAASILFLAGLGGRGLWQPNEPTYGQAVVEMERRGDWLVPTVNGIPFEEKPPLYYWTALAASRLLGGPSEWALRLPVALAGIAGVALLYLLVLPYAGRARALLAAALLATAEGWFWNSRSVQMDLPVAVSTLAAVSAVLGAVDRGRRPYRAFLLAGTAAGVGFLAKGPVAWICPAIAIVGYLVATRRLHRLRGGAPLAGAAVALALPLAWALALVAAGHAEFLREALFRQNATRFLSGFDHRGPWWYYLYYFWIDFAPWSWLVPLAFRLPDRDEDERRLDLLAWIWLAGVVLFFSLSASKRSPYMLPAAPAVAILASGLVERLLDGRLRGRAAAPALAVHALAGVVALGTAGLLFLRTIPEYPALRAPGTAIAGLFLAGGAALLLAVASRARGRAAPATLLALVTTVYLVAAVAVLPAVDGLKSARLFCERVRAVVPRDAELRSYRFWGWRASYSYYTGRTIPDLPTRDELARYLSAPGRVFVLVEDEHVAEAREVLGERAPLVRAPVGGSTAWLFASR